MGVYFISKHVISVIKCGYDEQEKNLLSRLKRQKNAQYKEFLHPIFRLNDIMIFLIQYLYLSVCVCVCVNCNFVSFLFFDKYLAFKSTFVLHACGVNSSGNATKIVCIKYASILITFYRKFFVPNISG